MKKEQKKSKKKYEKPQLKVYGDFRQLTRKVGTRQDPSGHNWTRT